MKTEFLYGRHPVEESLRAGRRQFKRLIVGQGSEKAEPIQVIIELAQTQNIPVGIVPRSQLNAQTQNVNHQGVILETGSYPYADMDHIFDAVSDSPRPALIILLDLIQDVQNVGTLLRTAEAVGVHGVVIQERRAANITPAVVSASSGAVEHLLVAQETNLVRAMEALKERGVWLAGLDMGYDAIRYDQANLKGGMGLVIGSEGKGLRRLVRETCDFIISLPMQGQIESLNASVAGSIALYAVWQAQGMPTG